MSDAAAYPQTKDNRPSRHPERAHYDVEVVHSILDEGLIAHVGFVADGRPHVLPMLYVRVGPAVYLHGSTGARINRMAVRDESMPISVEVTLVDALVLARSVFNHSANYRSVVASGTAALVRDEQQKSELLEALVEKLIPGRSTDARAPTEDELRQTAVLKLGLEEVSAKVRSGDPLDAADDVSYPCWAGLRPLLSSWGKPVPSGDLAADIELPSYLAPEGAPYSA